MGIANIINNSTTTSGGEIIRELVNASDGAGLHFDGSPGYIDIASPPDLGTKFSFEFIFKATTWTSGDYKFLVDFGGGSGRFIIGTNNSDNNLKIFDNVGYKDTGAVIFDDLAVHHVVVTVDGTAAVVYDNGNQVGSATISASHGIDTATDAAIATNIFGSSNNAVTGTYYRCRFYNKALSSAEVQTAYERADVPVADQYGSQTKENASTIINGSGGSLQYDTFSGASNTGFTAAYTTSGTQLATTPDEISLTKGKRYRVKFTYTYTSGQRPRVRLSTSATGSDLYTVFDINGLPASTGAQSVEFDYTGSNQTAVLKFDNTSAASYAISNLEVVQIGCVSDYQTQWANPTQSLTVQDASGNADGTCSASGVTQVQPVVQGNLTSLAVHTAAVTPADGEIIADRVTAANSGDTQSAELRNGELTLQRGSSTPTYINFPDSGASLQLRGPSYATALTIDSSGRTGIGKAAHASSLLDVNGTVMVSGSGNVKGVISNPSSDIFDIANASGGTSNPITFSTQGSERMRISSGGDLLLGKTTAGVTTLGVEARQNGILGASRDGATALYVERKSSDGSCVELIRGGTTVGTISVTGSATAYNTSSDYRLKENLEPLTGALDRLDQLPVYRFNFKADPDTTVDGFVAHEVQAHVPEAITGEKDAMKTVEIPAVLDDDGNEVEAARTEEQPDYQGIDQSKLVPLLVAAVKELKAKVETLENA